MMPSSMVQKRCTFFTGGAKNDFHRRDAETQSYRDKSENAEVQGNC